MEVFAALLLIRLVRLLSTSRGLVCSIDFSSLPGFLYQLEVAYLPNYQWFSRESILVILTLHQVQRRALAFRSLVGVHGSVGLEIDLRSTRDS